MSFRPRARWALLRMAVTACLMTALVAGPPPAAARPGLLGAINAVRAAGCGGNRGLNTPLRASRQLDAVARRISRGTQLGKALSAAGYRAMHSSSLFLSHSGSAEDIARAVAGRSCRELSNAAVHDIGIERRGEDIWIVLAAPFEAPALGNADEVSQQVLALANNARSRTRQCGRKSFDAAPPLVLASRLNDAAREHARDMAKHSELSHEGSDGTTPAQRVTQEGYAWRTVGENVASGPTSAEEVMAGWLESPGHCENLMDPRFTEMGIAYTVDSKSESGVYWAQVFATPRR
ncbi:MAG: CAP domain-containing protein [Gammaproteobacteria bacterium]